MSRPISARDFFFPGQDVGLAYTAPPPPPIVKGGSSRIRQIAASDVPALNRKMRSRMETRWRWPTDPPVFETLSCIMLAEDATFGQRRVQIAGGVVLSAAAGDRVWKSTLKPMQPAQEDELNRQFAARRDAGFQPLPVAEAVDDDIPFAVDLRNGYNFYHFLTEGLPQLAVIAAEDSGAAINIHLPVLAQLKGFVRAFVRDLFPALVGRVQFTDTPCRYPLVRLVYNHRHYLYQSSDARIAEAVDHLPADDPWHRLGSDRVTRKFLLKSTYDTGQRLLREQALALLDPAVAAGRPKRIWIGRDNSREDFKQRPNSGESELLDKLRALGFEVVYLEKLSPLDQVGVINAAEMIVAPHGAALSHMLFARANATVIEIGTPQTQLHRWGDFLGNAHVARCRYATVFADVEGAQDEAEVPSIEDGHRGIHFGAEAQKAVLGLIERFGGPPPDDRPDA